MFGLGLNGFRHQRPDVSQLVRRMPRLTLLQMNVSFQLVQADLVLSRGQARDLRTDFLILTQMSRMANGERSSLSRRALVAANKIMSMFHRRPDDERNGQLDRVIADCRRVAATVLGDVNKSGDSANRTTKVWGIGHWCAQPRMLNVILLI